METSMMGNTMMGGTTRWPHAPGGLPSSYDETFHRSDEDEPVFGRGTMKRNSQQYVEQAAGHAAGVRLTARHAAGGDGAGHAASAYPPHAGSAYPAPSAYAVGGKENAYRAAPGSKAAPLQSPRYGSNLAPPRSPRYTNSLGSSLAATSQQQPPPGHGSHLNHNLAARRAPPPSGAPPSGLISSRGGRTGLSAPEPAAGQQRPTGKWSINDDQMHQPWGKVLRNIAQPR
mmetsp:Transcript_31569/g.74527  ORF Transcript_31569/g.74527 Transcript_31569/m.74527 type:complete len:229 (-) Transcript_31569:150-836(-)